MARESALKISLPHVSSNPGNTEGHEEGWTVFTYYAIWFCTGRFFAYVGSQWWEKRPVPSLWSPQRGTTGPAWCMSFLANPEHSTRWHQLLGQTAAPHPSWQLISLSSQACRWRALSRHLRESLWDHWHIWVTSKQAKTKLLPEAPSSGATLLCLTRGYRLSKRSGTWVVLFTWEVC